MARPRKDEAIDIRGEAVRAAIIQLGEDPAGLSLSAIARRIGCSAPALYSHFDSKDDLLAQVRAAAFAEMMEAKRRRFVGLSAEPLARLAAGGHDYVDFARANPALYRLIFAPEAGKPAGKGGDKGHDQGHGQAPAHPEVNLDAAAIAPLAAGLGAAGPSAMGAEAAAEIAHMMWFTVHGAIMMALDGQLPGPEAARWARAHEAVDTVMRLLVSHFPTFRE
ncbi:TetR/AcrR family transcriptional regulator [Hoeflea olei]|nr:TetR/AcrR family transcriptional regulator [Hoeflea olei]